MKTDKNYMMPAEWEKHECTFMEWPVKESLVWPEDYKEVCSGYAEVAKAISEYEPIVVLVNEDTRDDAAKLCGNQVKQLVIPHNDAWMRDNGPTFVWDDTHQLAGVNWKFNAWGEKYQPYDLDDEVAGKVLDYLHLPKLDVPIVLEGGSIHVDGEGTLITTEQCLLNPNRNPDLSRQQIETILKERLHISSIIWLKNGLFGDETDGHVDNIACFARPGAVILQVCDDPEDPNYLITEENRKILEQAVDATGRKLKIIEIKQPPIRYYKDQRLTLSYLNFYFVNGGIVLPVFGDDAEETDNMAEEVLQSTFPERRIRRVDGMPLIKEGGNVHCITQQMPLGIKEVAER